ncbi:MAG: alpha/beta hydrolase [Phycisphaerales bacterium JB063]
MPELLTLFAVAFVLISLIGSAGLLLYIHRPRRKTFAVALAMGNPTDPSDLGLEGEAVQFNLPGPGGGHTSPGWIVKGGLPEGPAVIILHGHRDARFGSLIRAKKLAPYASHLVVFDWPAHGECTAPWMQFGQREIGDLLAVLDGLPDALTRNKPVLFGHSMGAQIAIKAAGLHDRFAGLIADGPYRRWDSPIRARMKRYRVPAWMFIYPVAGFYLLRGWLPGFDRLHFARQIKCPLLVIHGTHDPICPHHEGEELAQGAPDGTFVSIEGGGHIDLVGIDPETYHAALSTFFARVGEGLGAKG